MLGLLGPLASLLGIELEALKERLQRHAVVISAVGIFLAIGVVFLLVAANTALTYRVGPVLAPLILAAIALAIALAVYVGALLTDNIAQRRAAERKRSAETTALVTTAAITAVPLLFKSGLMKKVGLPMGGALAAAYLLTRPGSHRD